MQILGVIGTLMFVMLGACSFAQKNEGLRWPAGKVSSSFRTEIRDEQTFSQMANSEPGGVVRTGAVIKFLIDNRGNPQVPPVYFINARYCDSSGCPAKFVELHRTWAEKTLKNFNYDNKSFSAATYHTNDLNKKEFIAGRIQTFVADGKTFYGIWFVEMDQIAEETLAKALGVIRNHFSIPGAELHYVSYGLQQTTNRIQGWLEQNRMKVFQIGSLLSEVSYAPLNKGEAWGFLRMYPEDPDDLEPSEIAVFDQLPLDLAVVAGTITTAFQDVASHVNLKSKERGTPNMVVRDPAQIEKIRGFDGKPVHLVVREDQFTIKLTTPEIIQQKLQARAKKPWRPSKNDFSSQILHFDEMCRGQKSKVCLDLSTRYGGKASRLGFLAHEKVIGEQSAQHKKNGYRLSPLGFGLPISFYKEFVDYNMNQNPGFKSSLQGLIQSEMGLDGAGPLTTLQKKERVREIKEGFLKAQFPPGMYKKIEAEVSKLQQMVSKKYPGEVLNKLKIRSSANVEDIENFNGAGLHDSFSAKVKKSTAEQADDPCQIVTGSEDDEETKEEVEPESLACAVKATYASLWNLRAVRERTYRKFDHRDSYMGLAILPSYKFREVAQPKIKIAANSVLVTRVLNTTSVYGYQISTQAGNNLVTNPDGSTSAELAILAFQLSSVPTVTIARYATPKAGEPTLTTPVLSPEKLIQMVSLARTVEEAYCEAKGDYYKLSRCSAVSNSQRKPKALDLELKIYNNGEILLKQFREFAGH